MIFYDMEVFKYDWLGVFIDPYAKSTICIKNSTEQLKELYEKNKDTIWVGFNNKHYDQYIFKGILLGLDPKMINDHIIRDGMEGWQISRAFNQVPMINYDCMPNPPVGLKTLESFLGSDIRETEIPFDIDRRLTPKELEQTEYYCTHDVEETIKVFLQRIDNFEAMKGIVEAFPQVSIRDIGDSEARITAKVLECQWNDRHDEFQYFFLPCLRIRKYRKAMDWFVQRWQQASDDNLQDASEYVKKQFYKQSLTMDVAGVPHTFGFGGLHGAPKDPVHAKGQILHVDVNNYYPSMLCAWGLVTRSAHNDNYQAVYQTRKKMKMAQLAAKTKEEAKSWKKKQLPYKKMLNALSGAMKDRSNPAYDPRNNNAMCINGQLMLLDLIEHLEAGVEDFHLIQSNTDGLIIQVPDTDEAFQQVDDVCYEWECRCSTPKCQIALALDTIKEIYQKDVNNYLWIDADGGVEAIGAYVKDLSPIDNDLPVINKALRAYMIDKAPVEKTIMEDNNLADFQHCVKLSDKYDHVEHEEGMPQMMTTGKRIVKTQYTYSTTKRYTYKCYRVFASMDIRDGRLLKCGGSRGKPEKFGNTADHCFIYNQCTDGVSVPEKLDRKWYINLAKKRLEQFGIKE